ncbi:hypothetical protein T4B_4362 [Trichinella pseudospiralis]|uniref:Uncharacterized protein n=1 Tax=Trichinella pseudospiralis TaxID=6337 RepID=A0A0V1GQL3_TRIPS|nr:hypothetical protein T4B_4362 [Trichinella pseudospiralis]KRZ40134.1 hypothetical protein T4C_11619 [Trichinella pseudospiralis]KRZ40160.1 hypothetical protein T4C_11242 [Trichinella pseudospiralis]
MRRQKKLQGVQLRIQPLSQSLKQYLDDGSDCCDISLLERRSSTFIIRVDTPVPHYCFLPAFCEELSVSEKRATGRIAQRENATSSRRYTTAAGLRKMN